jgi:hypothetical protein
MRAALLGLVLLSGCATNGGGCESPSICDFAMFMLIGAGGAQPVSYTPAPQRCVGEWVGSRYYERCYD